MRRPDDQIAELELSPEQSSPVPPARQSDSRGPDAYRPEETHRPQPADALDEGPASRAALHERLEHLPRGHPSSPFNDDGSRKPPPPDLTQYELPLPDEEEPVAATWFQPQDTRAETGADYRETASETTGAPLTASDPERTPDAQPGGMAEAAAEATSASDQPPVEPLTDAEHAAHVHEIKARLADARADGLATEDQFSRDDDRDVWTHERSSLHDSILEDLYAAAADVPNERQAMIAGGLPGAGKSTILQGHAQIDLSRYFTIDPDKIKEELARRGMIPPIQGLSPMEASDLVHEESSHIARRLARRAQADGKNLIWDITMSSRETAEKRISNLRAAGYTHVEGIFVHISLDASEARAQARHRRGLEEYRAGAGYGGRFVGTDVIQKQADPEWGSLNRKAFEELKTSFDKWSIYDNSVDGRGPVLVDSSVSRERRHDQ